jgi:hypothetical protein
LVSYGNKEKGLPVGERVIQNAMRYPGGWHHVDLGDFWKKQISYCRTHRMHAPHVITLSKSHARRTSGTSTLFEKRQGRKEGRQRNRVKGGKGNRRRQGHLGSALQSGKLIWRLLTCVLIDLHSNRVFTCDRVKI